MMKHILKDMEARVLVASGAQGTELAKRGFSLGDNYGDWVLKHPDALKDLCSQYAECGVDIQSASCTSINRFRLEHYGLADQASRMCKNMVELTRKYCSDTCYVAGVLSDIGHLLEPLGDITYQEAYDSYKDQVLGIVEGGADLVMIGSIADIRTIEAAIGAVKDNSDLPVIASMAFDPTPKGPRTIMGVSPAQAAESLDQAGADVVGVNCGGILMDDVDAALKEMAQATRKPLFSKPNAGMPNVAEGEAAHPVSPEEMASHVPVWIKAGARVVSGCCGSGPEHISLIREAVKKSFTIHH
jgi:5-methyltetrahydrofolate--homocysteine methyltransferase